MEKVRLTISVRPEGQTVLVTEGKIIGGAFAGDRTYTEAVIASTDLLSCHTRQGLTSTVGPRVVKFLTTL